MLDEEQNRRDAAVAKHVRRSPGAFARLLATLTGQERRETEERLTRGLAWLARTEQKEGRADDQA